MQFERRLCNQFVTKPSNLTENLSGEQIKCPIVQQSLRKIIKNEKYTKYSIKNKTLPANLGNYLGDLFEIDIKGKTEDGENESYLFVKHVVPEEGLVKGLVDIEHSYRNEVFMYSELQDVFHEIYKEAGVLKEKRLRTVKNYDCNNHVIVLDNLSRKGYKLLPRLAVTPLPFAEDAIKQIAKFHALSFALEHNRRDYFEKNIKNLKIPLYVEDENGSICDPWKNFATMMANQSFEHCFIESVKIKKEQLVEKIFEIIPSFFTGKRATSVRCMCHGDFKPNNILYKNVLNEEIETVLIDFQLINYGSPVQDIIFFLYTGTDRAFRKDHMEDLKDIYYESLKEALNDFDLNINKIYPRSLFEKDFRNTIEFGLLLSLIILPCILTEDPEFFKRDITDKMPTSSDVLTERLNGLFEEFFEWGIL